MISASFTYDGGRFPCRASPLILGLDARKLKERPDCLELLLNRDILAVNQDPAGLPPRLVHQTPPEGTPNLTSVEIEAQAFARPLSGGRLAVLLLNRAPAARRLRASWEQLRIAAAEERRVYDVVARHWLDEPARGEWAATVPSHDVSFVILAKSGLPSGLS
jgi:alpha-galactosidase